MKEVIISLLAAGERAVLLTLQKIHPGGGTPVWIYSTMVPQAKANFFGDSGVSFTCSTLDTSAPRTAGGSKAKDINTVWLNGIDDVEAELFRKEYGSQCVGIVADDGAINMLTVGLAEKYLASLQPSSEQPQIHAS